MNTNLCCTVHLLAWCDPPHLQESSANVMQPHLHPSHARFSNSEQLATGYCKLIFSTIPKAVLCHSCSLHFASIPEPQSSVTDTLILILNPAVSFLRVHYPSTSFNDKGPGLSTIWVTFEFLRTLRFNNFSGTIPQYYTYEIYQIIDLTTHNGVPHFSWATRTC